VWGGGGEEERFRHGNRERGRETENARPREKKRGGLAI